MRQRDEKEEVLNIHNKWLEINFRDSAGPGRHGEVILVGVHQAQNDAVHVIRLEVGGNQDSCLLAFVNFDSLVLRRKRILCAGNEHKRHTEIHGKIEKNIIKDLE